MRHYQWFSCLVAFCLIGLLISACNNNNTSSPMPTPTMPSLVQTTLTSQQTQSQTVRVTGQGTTPGTQATGMLTFSEPYINTGPFTFNAGTVFNDDFNRTPNVQMMIDATITVPTEGNGSVTVPAHVVQKGTIGNIPIKGWTHYYNHSDAEPVDIHNSTPFTGGTDPQTYIVVQQSDIDGAANVLKASTQQSAAADLNSQLSQSEHLVGDPQCTYNVSSDHAVGDRATTFTETVQAICQQTAISIGDKSKITQLIPHQALTCNTTTKVLDCNYLETTVPVSDPYYIVFDATMSFPYFPYPAAVTVNNVKCKDWCNQGLYDGTHNHIGVSTGWAIAHGGWEKDTWYLLFNS
jgi:hypothetical protein